MDMDGGTITLAIAVLTPAAAALTSYVTLRERVNRHDRSVENLGIRLEAEKEARTKEIAALLERVALLDKRVDVDRAELSRPYSIRPREPGGVVR